MKPAYVHTRQQVCHWSPMHPEEGGAWETQCGDAFLFIDGDPVSNRMNFCPYCGGALIQVEDSTDENH